MKNVSKTLTNHIKTITELANRLEKDKGNLPQIEVDMLLSALREMYDDVYRLNLTPAAVEPEPQPIPEPVAPKPAVEPVVAVPEPEPEPSILMVDTESKPVYAEEPEPEMPANVTSDQPSIDEIEGRPNNDLFEDEPEPEPVPEPEIVEPEPAAAPKEEPKAEPKEEPKQTPQPSLFDYFKSGNGEKPASRTIADTLGNSVKEGIEQKISANKVGDLRTIININDKFSFMNELFHNNMKGYNDFILRLNAINGREEALAYVQSTAEQYGWDNESLAVKTFYSIFDRKF